MTDGEHRILLEHARRWAETKKRPLDADLVETVLGLRTAYDDRSAQSWPAGSAEDLVLVRWPAHGPRELPALDALSGSLDTFWRFLRATGRMSSGSAEPAALLKELRRALPGMAEASADRANWSQGRVFADFGASIGIDLEMSESAEELQEKLDRIMAAWNALPTEQRIELMPDPAPRSASGVAFTDLVNEHLAAGGTADPRPPGRGGEEDEDDVPELRRGDPVIAAREARSSALTTACLRLAGWVGGRAEVTASGVLRPAVAREAYAVLGLFEWERTHQRHLRHLAESDDLGDEEWAELARTSSAGWRSALDCVALDRLWWACRTAGLVDVGATVARATVEQPTSDREWVELACLLLLGIVHRQGLTWSEPLLGTLLFAMLADDGEVPLGVVREWWLERQGLPPDAADDADTDDHDLPRLLRWIITEQVDEVLRMFDDAQLWVRQGDWLTITELGREFGGMLSAAVERDLFAED
ncbi:MAG TPA: hypothetical protein VES95_03205 [Dermatophilaceae bacterium]|nr:hypothetical protein [Dermatophilaceae bacterium]